MGTLLDKTLLHEILDPFLLLPDTTVVVTILRHFGTGHFADDPLLTPQHFDTLTFWRRDILTPWHFAGETFCHQDIVSQRHFAIQTLCRQDILTLLEKKELLLPKTYSHPDVLPPIFFLHYKNFIVIFWLSPSSGLTNPPPPQEFLESPFRRPLPPPPRKLLESPFLHGILCRTAWSYPSELLCALVV